MTCPGNFTRMGTVIKNQSDKEVVACHIGNPVSPAMVDLLNDPIAFSCRKDQPTQDLSV